jgi:hypothetical protein
MRQIFKVTKKDRWLVISWAAIGVLFVFPVVAQLLDTKLIEPIATLWGSALGAIAAVAGAFWVADRQATQQRRSAAALVRAMFLPVAFALDQLNMAYGAPSRPDRGDSNDEPDILSPEEWSNIFEHAGFVMDYYKDFQSKIHRYEAGLNLLSASSLRTALALESELDGGIHRAVGPLLLRGDPGVNGAYLFYPGHPTWSSRMELTLLNQDVQNYMARLEHDAS